MTVVWLHIDTDSDFSMHNLPFGVFHLISEDIDHSRCATRIGDWIIDLRMLEEQGYIQVQDNEKYFNQATLIKFMDLSRKDWRAVRERIQRLFRKGSPIEAQIAEQSPVFMHRAADVKMELPATIGDYTDFYSSRNHAENIGVMFRGKDNALQPNWIWLPVGYHGRASTVCVSGTDIHRPYGQIKTSTEDKPTFKATEKMDFELEMAHFIGSKGNKLGHPIDVNQADDKIFGLVLMNDWSARDIQAWEYVPLGPFNSKNLGTVISPWIITLDALEMFKVDLLPIEKEVPDYLRDTIHSSYDINLQVYIKSKAMESEHLLSTSNFKYMYWTMAQQIAHHTITGCNLRTGDLLGSGTISGPDHSEYGSMIELTNNGKNKIELPNSEERAFLKDYDTVVLRGFAEKDGIRIGFGDCVSTILPAIDRG